MSCTKEKRSVGLTGQSPESNILAHSASIVRLRAILNSHNTIRRLFSAVALLALLFFATSIGEALHHHDTASADAHCQICHVSHQSVEKAANAQGAAAPELLGSLPVPQALSFIARLRVDLSGTRAPPSA
jgi:hypothetical protein